MAKKKPKVYTVFDRRNQVKTTGVGKVEIVVNLNGKQNKYISVGSCKPEDYYRYLLKRSVVEKIFEAERVYDLLVELGEELTIGNYNHHAGIKTSKPRLTKEQKKEQERRGSFINFMREALNAEKISPSTYKRKARAITALEKAGFMKTFNDVTVPNIYRFEDYLQKPYKLKRAKNVQLITRDQTTIYGYHKVIHQYATRAWRFGIIDVDPYNLVKLDHGTYAERIPLTEEEVKRICDLEGMNYQMTMARDLFVFACYTGLAYIDTQAFVYEESVVEHNGMLFIDRHRVKTGIRYLTPIYKPAMEVLKRYNNNLPHISNQKLNGYLKIIGEMAKIKKNVTFHVARHTFATIALAHDIPMENVSRMLGHSNTRTTAVYAKILDFTVQRDAEEISDELLDMTPSALSEDDAKINEQIYGKYKPASDDKDALLNKDAEETKYVTVASAESAHPEPKRKRRRRHKRSVVLEENRVNNCDTKDVKEVDTPRAEDVARIDYPGTSFGFNFTGYYTMW